MVENTLEIQVNNDNSEQSFLDELIGFKARINALSIPEREEAKKKLAKLTKEFEDDLKNCDFQKYWDYEVLRLLRLNQSKLKYVCDLL